MTTVPAKKKELQKSQLLGFVELPEGFTPFSQASKITYEQIQHGWSKIYNKGPTQLFLQLEISKRKQIYDLTNTEDELC